MPIRFIVNDQPVEVDCDPALPLLDVLRGQLRLTGTKQGCDHEGECGACTVLLEEQPVRACLTPVGGAAGKRVLTVEGLARDGQLDPLQAAFIEVGAVQCGFCTPGVLMAAKGLLLREPRPDRGQIVEAIEGNLCRCTGYNRIVQAVELAADARAPLFSFDPQRKLGGSAERSDSVGKVTGETQYVEDMRPPGMLVMKTVRSPYHHARLSGLDAAPAEQTPGVRRVFTWKDIPAENGFPDYSLAEPILTPVGDTLRMKGAPIALVVAENEAAAEAGCAAVRLELQELPHVFDVEEALQPGAVYVCGDGNELSRFDFQRGSLADSFAQSSAVVEATYDTAYLEHTALERESALGMIDEAGRVTVIGATHQPHNQQRFVAEMLGLPVEQIRCITPPIGGSFGGKQDPWPMLAVGLAAYWLREPVRLDFSRQESFDASPKRHPYRVKIKLGADSSGRLTGLYGRILANTGGYDSCGRYITNYAVTAAGGAYRWQAVDLQARSVYTNGPKSGQYRGFGTAQSTFALECALDELIETMGAHPVEFRRRNGIGRGEHSFLGYPLVDPLGYHKVLDAIQPYYQRYTAEAEAFNQAHSPAKKRRGVGLAGMWYRFGKAGKLRIEAHAEIGLDGRLAVYCSAPDYGQGTSTAMSQMAAESLGVARAQIDLINADTGRVPNSEIQGASRAVFFVGGAVSKAGAALRESILGVAAEMIDAPVEALEFSGERVVIRAQPQRGAGLREIAAEFERMGKNRRVKGIFDITDQLPAERPEYLPLFITGAQLAEVEVDMETGAVTVRRVAAAHDVGRVVNPLDASGQIEGAVVMGVGAALQEEYLPGVTGGISEYYVPTASEAPEIHSLLIEEPSLYGPYGAKGLGEAAMLPTAPAIINALSRAIGRRIRAIPATPERVLAAIYEAAYE